MKPFYYKVRILDGSLAPFFLRTESLIAEQTLVSGLRVDREGSRIETEGTDADGDTFTEYRHIIQHGAAKFMRYEMDYHYGHLVPFGKATPVDRDDIDVAPAPTDDVCLAGNPKPSSERACGEPDCVCS